MLDRPLNGVVSLRGVDCCGDMTDQARHGDFRINIHYSRGGGGGFVVGQMT